MKWFGALLAFVALGLGSIHTGWFAAIPGASSAHNLEKSLQESAGQALRDAGINWATVHIRGQSAHVSGTAPSKEARDQAREAILHSTWRGGIIMGGVTIVRSKNVLIASANPSNFWQARKAANGEWTFSGTLHDEAVRKYMRDDAAGADKQNALTDQMNTSPDITRKWDDRAQTLFNALEQLDFGTASLKANAQSLQGSTTNPQIKAALEQVFAIMPASFNAAITIDLAAKKEEKNQSVEEKVVDLAWCQGSFLEALNGNSIYFTSSKAIISPDSFALLDSLADITIACSAFHFTITGHTDRLGDPAFNNWLSEQRALAVSRYLADKGATTMATRGAGSREPLCQANTRACRKQNRRIEISVE